MTNSSFPLRRTRRNRGRKGQQALEFLVTYAWALVVVIVVVGAFAYFGLLNPQKYLPARCDFGVQLVCADYLFESVGGMDNGVVKIRFLNSFGRDIRINDIQTVNGEGTFSITPDPGTGYMLITAGNVNNSHVLELDLTGTEYFVNLGSKSLVELKINFSRDEPGVPTSSLPTHIVFGEVYAQGQES